MEGRKGRGSCEAIRGEGASRKREEIKVQGTRMDIDRERERERLDFFHIEAKMTMFRIQSLH